MTGRRSRLLFLSALGAALLSLVLSLARWDEAAADAGASVERLARCGALLEAVEALSSRPRGASPGEIGVSELTRLIETASKASGVRPQALYRIEPEPAHRVGESAYLEKETRVELHEVGFGAFLRLLHELGGEGGTLTVTALRLQASRSDEIGDTWNAEVTLSYLIYSPREEGSG